MKQIKKSKKILTLFVFVFMAAAFSFFASRTFAATPILTLSGTGDGDSIQVNVNGDPSKPVILYYMKTNTGPQLSSLGSTNSNGSFSAKVSTATYGISPDSLVHVIVNGQQSANAAWPYIATGSMLSLSQTSLVLPPGQSSTITADNNGTNFLYLSSNSNPPAANVSISGKNITITAINYGATVVTICAQSAAPACASTYINIQNTGAKPLLFGQNNVSIASNQSVPVTIYGGTGTYVILNNSNAGIIQSALNGNIVTLSAKNNTSGFSAITLCSSNMSSCGIINANIGSANSSGITLDQLNPTLTIGQSLKIPISGGIAGTYKVLYNTDESIVRAELTSDSLLLTPVASGSATVTVCSEAGKCGAVAATVANNYSNTGGTLTLSQNNLWLLVGQSFGINISGGSTPYSVLAPTDNILSTSLNGGILTVTGVNPGSTSVNVCSAEGGCTALSVLVNGTSYTAPITLSQNTYSLSVGENATVAISGNGGYYISQNTNPNIVSAAISGNNADISSLNIGNASISICQNGGQCAVLSISVFSAPAVPQDTATTPTTTPITPLAQPISFPDNTLVRNQKGKIYIIYNNKKKHIATLAQLQKYACKKITEVTDENLSRIPDTETLPAIPPTTPITSLTFQDNSLVRDQGGRIYVIYHNTKRHVTTLAELRQKYVGKKAVDISDDVLSRIPNFDANTENNNTSKFKFQSALYYGTTGNDVKELQKRLVAEGFFNDQSTGRYLSSTVAAVKKYQKSKGIKQTGNVGPQTMAALNQ